QYDNAGDNECECGDAGAMSAKPTQIERGAVGRRGESGQAILIMLMGMAGFIAMLGLVADTGWSYYQLRQAQTAADAGALAGVHALILSSVSGTCAAADVQSDVNYDV